MALPWPNSISMSCTLPSEFRRVSCSKKYSISLTNASFPLFWYLLETFPRRIDNWLQETARSDPGVYQVRSHKSHMKIQTLYIIFRTQSHTNHTRMSGDTVFQCINFIPLFYCKYIVLPKCILFDS